MQSLLKPNTKFLTGIIPANWIEVIFEYEDYYLIHVTGDEDTSEEQWDAYQNELYNEFQDQVDYIYRLPEVNITFEVYLNKSLVTY